MISRVYVMKPQYTPVEHSLEFSRRRRALFPSTENPGNSSGLGCISPLVLETNDEDISQNPSIGDYDIIGLVDKDNTVNTPDSSVPYPVSKLGTPHTDASPTQNLRTPHDVSNNCKLPKLAPRKPIINDDTLSQDTSKISKVRTALFPDPHMSLSRNKSPKKTMQPLFLCNRRSRSKSGQINAGVKHRIRKPKKKRSLRKTAALRAALNVNKNETHEEKKNLKPLPEPPPKVFKTPPPQTKGVISFNNNIRFELVNGKMSFTVNKNKLKRPLPQEPCMSKRSKLDVPTFDDGKPIESNEIANIIECLDDKENKNQSIGLMSPTSLMCNMTSGLALNSPKKVINLSPILEKMSPTPVTTKRKLYPVFYPDNKRHASPPKAEITKNPAKRFRPIAKDQMLLDAGQKRWGVTQCNECKFVYHIGDPSDEVIHQNYHNAEHIFRYNGWKNERVVTNSLLDGKVVQIVPGDPKIWWKKVKEVIEVVNRDLGFYDMVFNTEKSQIFFYIKNRIIVGVLVAEVISSAHRLLTTAADQVDLCSEESYPVKCGISRIWVSQLHRKKGIASAMMEALRRNFMMGYILKTEDIALSSPTASGKSFGKQYFKTENFFIYFV